ncbi:MAG: DNA metabolism protein [Actinobacteria bacterium]|nr:MAG: DNA metabolism protein [Actinomycetota bacterium]
MPDIFVYDGGFEGLLTTLFRLLQGREEPEDIRAEGKALQESLLAETVMVRTDAELAERLSRDICERISSRALRNVLNAFLSGREGAEYNIYRYLRLGWELGADVDARLGDEHVHAVHGMSRCTAREAHRMRGFLRFRQLEDGMYYAPMRSQCDVLSLVAGYFTARMGDQDWVIHDLVREQAAFCLAGELAFCDLPGFDPRFSGEEELCQELWRMYYKTIAVSERRNSRLQKSCMPMKYWSILVEEPARPGGRASEWA